MSREYDEYQRFGLVSFGRNNIDANFLKGLLACSEVDSPTFYNAPF